MRAGEADVACGVVLGIATLAVWLLLLPRPRLGDSGFLDRPSGMDAANDGSGECGVSVMLLASVDALDGRREERVAEATGR